MGRAHRIDIEGGIHHVMNRGVDHRPIFFGDADRVEFGRLLAEIADRFAVQVHAYCLMDNHYHLLVECPDGGLSDAMHHLGSVFVRHTNDRIGRDGPLFRARFRSLHVATDRYFLRAVRYIHRNALDVRGVDDVADYRWSSHRAYLGLRRVPEFLRTDRVLGAFRDPRSFHRFVAEDPSPANAVPTDIDDVRWVIGVALAHAVAMSESCRAPQSAHRQFRTIGALLLRELPEPAAELLRRELAFANRRAELNAMSRARAALADDPVLARAMSAIRSELGVLDRCQAPIEDGVQERRE